MESHPDARRRGGGARGAQRPFRRLPGLLGLAVLLLGPLPLGARRLTYPAVGNLDLEEGTIEIWLTPMRPLYPLASSYQGLFSCCALRDGNFTATFSWYAKNNTQYVETNIAGSDLNSVTGSAPPDWTPGQMHYLAFSWQGSVMTIFADEQAGESRRISQRGQRVQIGAFDRGGSLRDTLIVSGNRDGYTSYVIVHAIRVSAVARPLAGAPVPALERAALDDAPTLLLDIYDADYVNGTTRPAVIAGLSGEQGGSGNGVFVPAGSREQGLLAEPITVPASGFRMY